MLNKSEQFFKLGKVKFMAPEIERRTHCWVYKLFFHLTNHPCHWLIFIYYLLPSDHLHLENITCPHYNTPSTFNSLPFITSIWFMIFGERNCYPKETYKLVLEIQVISSQLLASVFTKFQGVISWITPFNGNLLYCIANNTFASLWYYCTWISNIGNIQVITNQDCCWSSRTIIPVSIFLRIQKIWISPLVWFTCKLTQVTG